MKQLSLELFKSVAFFLGHPIDDKKIKRHSVRIGLEKGQTHQETRKGPSTFGKALNVKDYGIRSWSRTSRNNTSVDFANRNSTFAQSTLLVKANLSFLFAHDRTLRNNTDEDLAKRNANKRDRSIFNVL